MLTPQAAAKKAGVSRPTVMNALKSKDLYAIRDNRNRWQINEEDLEKWVSDRTVTLTVNDSKAVDTSDSDLREEIAVLKTEKAVLSAEISGKIEMIEQLRADLEYARLPFWRKMVGK